MLDQTNRAAERLTRQVIDGRLAIIEMRVRNSFQVLVDQVLDNAEVLADRRGADLLVIAYHY